MWIDINKNNILRKEEKEMENKKLVVKGTEMEVVDGKYLVHRYFGRKIRNYRGTGNPLYLI